MSDESPSGNHPGLGLTTSFLEGIAGSLEGVYNLRTFGRTGPQEKCLYRAPDREVWVTDIREGGSDPHRISSPSQRARCRPTKPTAVGLEYDSVKYTQAKFEWGRIFNCGWGMQFKVIDKNGHSVIPWDEAFQPESSDGIAIDHEVFLREFHNHDGRDFICDICDNGRIYDLYKMVAHVKANHDWDELVTYLRADTKFKQKEGCALM